MRFGSAVRHASLGSPRAWAGLLMRGGGDSPTRATRARGFCLLRMMGRIVWTLGELRFGSGSAGLLPQTRAQSRLTASSAAEARVPVLSKTKTKTKTKIKTKTAEDINVANHLPSATQRLASPATLPEQVRSVLRLLPNSIVVCTSAHGSTPRGMTMSSFTSLSLSPTPLISFNVATPSRTLDAIRETGLFNIHVMSGDARGMAVAERFTRGNFEDVFRDMPHAATTTLTTTTTTATRTATATATTTTATARGGEGHGARAAIPLLEGDGVLYALRCRLLPDGPAGGLVTVRDHVIVLGEVLGVIPGTGTEEFGLAYADRRYRHVGGVIDDEPGQGKA